jgi:MFS family permease
MTIKIKKEKLWHKDYITIMVAACGIAFTTHFFLSTLPIYAQKLSGTAAYAGFMTGAYTLSALAVRPISGILTDKIGRVKMLMAGAFMCAVACVCYNFAGSIILLIALRVMNGIGFGIHSTASGAVAADIVPKSRLMEGLGYYGLYGTIAQAIAPAIAISIVADGHTDKFTFLFILASVISIGSMILDYTISYERKRKKVIAKAVDVNRVGQKNNHYTQNETGNEKSSKTFFGFEYAAMLPALVILLIFLGQSSIMSFLALYANEAKIGNIGLFFPIFAAGMFVSRIFAGRIGDKYGPNVVIIPSIMVSSMCYLAIPFIHSLAFLLCVAFPIGLSLGAASPALNSLVLKRTSPSRRGSAAATYFSAVDIGVGVGSIFFGFIIASFGFKYMFLGSSLSVLSALLIYIFCLASKVKLS